MIHLSGENRSLALEIRTAGAFGLTGVRIRSTSTAGSWHRTKDHSGARARSVLQSSAYHAGRAVPQNLTYFQAGT